MPDFSQMSAPALSDTPCQGEPLFNAVFGTSAVLGPDGSVHVAGPVVSVRLPIAEIRSSVWSLNPIAGMSASGNRGEQERDRKGIDAQQGFGHSGSADGMDPPGVVVGEVQQGVSAQGQGSLDQQVLAADRCEKYDATGSDATGSESHKFTVLMSNGAVGSARENFDEAGSDSHKSTECVSFSGVSEQAAGNDVKMSGGQVMDLHFRTFAEKRRIFGGESCKAVVPRGSDHCSSGHVAVKSVPGSDHCSSGHEAVKSVPGSYHHKVFQDGDACPDEGKTHTRGDPYPGGSSHHKVFQDGVGAFPEEGETHARGDPYPGGSVIFAGTIFQDGVGAFPEEGETHMRGDPCGSATHGSDPSIASISSCSLALVNGATHPSALQCHANAGSEPSRSSSAVSADGALWPPDLLCSHDLCVLPEACVPDEAAFDAGKKGGIVPRGAKAYCDDGRTCAAVLPGALLEPVAGQVGCRGTGGALLAVGFDADYCGAALLKTPTLDSDKPNAICVSPSASDAGQSEEVDKPSPRCGLEGGSNSSIECAAAKEDCDIGSLALLGSKACCSDMTLGSPTAKKKGRKQKKRGQVQQATHDPVESRASQAEALIAAFNREFDCQEDYSRWKALQQ